MPFNGRLMAKKPNRTCAIQSDVRLAEEIEQTLLFCRYLNDVNDKQLERSLKMKYLFFYNYIKGIIVNYFIKITFYIKVLDYENILKTIYYKNVHRSSL